MTCAGTAPASRSLPPVVSELSSPLTRRWWHLVVLVGIVGTIRDALAAVRERRGQSVFRPESNSSREFPRTRRLERCLTRP